MRTEKFEISLSADGHLKIKAQVSPTCGGVALMEALVALGNESVEWRASVLSACKVVIEELDI